MVHKILPEDSLEIDYFQKYFTDKIFYTNCTFWTQVKSKIKILRQNKHPSGHGPF